LFSFLYAISFGQQHDSRDKPAREGNITLKYTPPSGGTGLEVVATFKWFYMDGYYERNNETYRPTIWFYPVSSKCTGIIIDGKRYSKSDLVVNKTDYDYTWKAHMSGTRCALVTDYQKCGNLAIFQMGKSSYPNVGCSFYTAYSASKTKEPVPFPGLGNPRLKYYSGGDNLKKCLELNRASSSSSSGRSSVSNPYQVNNSNSFNNNNSSARNRRSYEQRRQQRIARARVQASKRMAVVTEQAVTNLTNFANAYIENRARQRERTRIRKELREEIEAQYKPIIAEFKEEGKKLESWKKKDRFYSYNDYKYYCAWRDYYRESMSLLSKWKWYDIDVANSKALGSKISYRGPSRRSIPTPTIKLSDPKTFTHVDFYKSAKYNNSDNNKFALELIQQALYLQPTNIEYNLYYAQILCAVKQYTKEKEVLNYVLALNPGNKPATDRLYQLSVSANLEPFFAEYDKAYKAKNYKKALEISNKIESVPDWTLSCNEIAHYSDKVYIYNMLGEQKESIALCDKMLGRKISTFYRYIFFYRKMWCYSSLYDFKNVRFYASLVIDMSKKNNRLIKPIYAYRAAENYFKFIAEGNRGLAKANFEHVIKLIEGGKGYTYKYFNEKYSYAYLHAYNKLQIMAAQEKQYGKSREYLNKMIEIFNKNFEKYKKGENFKFNYYNLWRRYVERLYQEGQYKYIVSKVDFYLDAVKSDFREQQEVYFMLINSAEKLGKKGKAKSLAKKFIKACDNRANANVLVAYHCYMDELYDYETAIKYLDKAVTLNSEGYAANYYIGSTYLATKNPQKALPYLKKASVLKPEKKWSHYNLGKAYVKCGKKADAATCFNKVIEMEKRVKKNYLYLPELTPFAYFYLGNKEAAKKIMKQYMDHKVKYKSTLGSAYFNCACLNSLMNNKQEAIRCLKISMENGYNLRALVTDIDFDSIRDVADFKALVKEYVR